MKAEDVYTSDILCPEGCFWKNNNNPYNSKDSGVYTIVSNSADDNKQYDIASLSFEKGVLNGKAVFYHENNREEYAYNNNMKSGWGVVLFNSLEIIKLFYKSGKLLRKLERSSIREDYWKEIDVNNGNLLGYFTLDKNNNRTGIGYIYCNGVIEGVYEFDNDNKGQCVKSMRDGIMKEYVNGEEVYCGNFEDSFELDFARSDLSNSPFLYKGDMKNGLPDGEGTLYDETHHVIHNGNWSNGLIQVEGGMWFDYSSKLYCGFYDNGSKKYEGRIKKGLPEGEGVYYSKTGVVMYIGLWKNGYYRIDSALVFSYRYEIPCVLYDDGAIRYDGGMNDGLPEGHGIYYDRNGVVKYEGNWSKGLFEVSKGIMFDYVSENLLVYYDDESLKYRGKMSNGIPDGEGVYYNKDSSEEFEGIWENGLLRIEEMWFDYSSEQFCGFYDDGSKKYEGEMSNGLPDGIGVYYDENGSELYKGYWEDGEFNIEDNWWFSYLSGEVEMRSMSLSEWITTKTGKLVTKTILVHIVIIGLLILGVTYSVINIILLIPIFFIYLFVMIFMAKSDFFFRRGSGYLLKDDKLIISGGNFVESNFKISGYNTIKTIFVKKNSLSNLLSLKICDCDLLESIIVEDGDYDSSAFRRAGSLYLKSNSFCIYSIERSS